MHAEALGYFPTEGGKTLKSLSSKSTLNVCLCVYKILQIYAYIPLIYVCKHPRIYVCMYRFSFMCVCV